MGAKVPLVFSILFAFGCQNPTKVVEKEKREFERSYSHQQIVTSSTRRPMRLIWNGSPQAQPVLFVHGSPGESSNWAHFLINKDLSQKYYMLSVDRPGYGGSGGGRTEPSLINQADDILSAIRFIDRPVILVGHSLGVPVVAQMARLQPQKVKGLVLVAGAVDPSLEKIKWFQYPAKWKIFSWLVPDPLRVCNEEIFPLEKELERLSLEWPLIEIPTVIIHGRKDNLVPIENVDFLKKKMQPKWVRNIVLVDDLNHFVPWKRPDLIINAIESF